MLEKNAVAMSVCVCVSIYADWLVSEQKMVEQEGGVGRGDGCINNPRCPLYVVVAITYRDPRKIVQCREPMRQAQCESMSVSMAKAGRVPQRDGRAFDC